MTEDKEKTIAEIRDKYHQWLEKHPFAEEYTISTVEFEAILYELERIEQEYAEERAAHNAHMTELIEKEEECRKLREERDQLQNDLLRDSVQSLDYAIDTRQEIERLREHVSRAWKACWKVAGDDTKIEQKLIEGLRMYAEGWIGSRDEGKHARDILKAVGVEVE